MKSRRFDKSGTWRVYFKGSDQIMANVRIKYSDGDVKVYLQELGEGDWEENFDAVGLLLGGYGRVEQVES